MGCIEENFPIDAGIANQACALMVGQDAQFLSAGVTPESAPEVTDFHRKVEVDTENLETDVGYITIPSNEITERFFFLSRDIPVSLVDSLNAEVLLSGQGVSLEECSEVRAYYVYALDTQNYTLKIGPTSSSTVGLVIR